MGLSCSVAWKAVVRWTDSAASFFESRRRELAFFLVAALDFFDEDDFDPVCPFEVDDFALLPFFRDFFAVCDCFCDAAAGSRASTNEEPASREPTRIAIWNRNRNFNFASLLGSSHLYSKPRSSV